MEPETVIDQVKEYYGKTIKKTEDLQTSACVMADPIPKHVRDILKEVHDEVIATFYGCGLVVPECLEGASVLDLGSGTGRDCFVLSKMVGEEGKVVGVDMTKEQLDVAKKYEQYHADKFGYSKPNTEFLKGHIEDLQSIGVESDKFDIIVSNCVVNLSPDKKSVLSEAYRVLKHGGELYFSDVYSDRSLPDEIRKHKVLWGECVAGALCWEELMTLASEIGFSQPRLVTARKLSIDKEDLRQVVEGYNFVSATYRLFKLPADEWDEAKSAHVVYDGEISYCEEELEFDYNTEFVSDQPVRVSAELVRILKSSRFRNHFEIGAADIGEVRKFKVLNPFDVGGEAAAGCCGTSGGKEAESDEEEVTSCCVGDGSKEATNSGPDSKRARMDDKVKE